MGQSFSGARTLAWLAAAFAGCAHPAPVVEHGAFVAPAPAPVVAAPSPTPPPIDRFRIERPSGEGGSPVFSVAADAHNVYFNDGAGRLWEAPKDGSARATALVDDAHDSVRSFVVVGDLVFYAGRRGIRSVPVSGGDSEPVVANASGPILLVTDGRSIFHTVFDGSAIYRFSLLAPHHEERFCAGAKHQTLAVDDTHLYVANYFAGTIVAVSKTTRRARVLASGIRHPVRLAVDAGYVYFTSEADGTVRRVGKHGGRCQLIARGQHEQEHLALDDGYVYWATRMPDGAHALVRASAKPEPGVAPEELYRGLTSAAGLAVDAGWVYVADRGAGDVVRVAKKE